MGLFDSLRRSYKGARSIPFQEMKLGVSYGVTEHGYVALPPVQKTVHATTPRKGTQESLTDQTIADISRRRISKEKEIGNLEGPFVMPKYSGPHIPDEEFARAELKRKELMLATVRKEAWQRMTGRTPPRSHEIFNGIKGLRTRLMIPRSG